MRESVGRIARGFGHKYFAEVVAADESPHELWKALGEHGFMGAAIADRVRRRAAPACSSWRSSRKS